MARSCDLLVVGAGPAGTAAGIVAADAGLDVILCDRARFPRDKTCGDGLTTAALRHLEALGVDAPSLPGYRRIHETVVVSPSGRHAHLPLPDDGHHAAVIRRCDLDAALVRAARARGVDVREGTTVRRVTLGDRGVDVDAGDTSARARWVVAADGHWSAVRRAIPPPVGGGRPDLGEWHAARQYFRGVDDPRLWIVFERDLLPGYAWVFPLPGGGANVGYGVLRDDRRRGADLNALWPDLLERPALRSILGPNAEPSGPLRAWPIPTRFDPSRLTAERVLFAGDAAGVVDPMTGEGIAQALETGALAAEAIATGAPAPAVARRYRHSVQRALGADLRFAAALQRILTRPRGARVAVRAADATAWTRRNFARWLFEDYPRALVLTPRRWRRGMFTPPGAFTRPGR